MQNLEPLKNRSHACQHYDFWGQNRAPTWLLQELSERQGDGMVSRGDAKDETRFHKKITKVQSVNIFARTVTDMQTK